MLEKLAEVEARYNELEKMMGDPEIAQDYEKVAELAKERSDLQDIVEAYRTYQKQEEELEGAKELLYSTDDPEMKEMAQMEVAELEESTEELLEKLKFMLLPKDPRDSKNVIVEIRAGAGGDEAGIFAGIYCACTPVMQRATSGKSRCLTSTNRGTVSIKISPSRLKGMVHLVV